MTRTSAKHDRRKRRSRPIPGIVKWVGLAAGLTVLIYVLSQSAGVAYSDEDIRVVDFSSLTSQEKKSALQAVNRARCNCSCGMTLAQCVVTDSTCPIREQNISKIRTMVSEADQP